MLRSFLIPFIVTAAAFTAPAAEKKPNIITILVDDMGYADVGFNGCKDIRTPNLDQLASQSAVLESFYAQPVCSPEWPR